LPYLSHYRSRRYAALARGFEVPPAALSTAADVMFRILILYSSPDSQGQLGALEVTDFA
jgi:hypothetical protein